MSIKINNTIVIDDDRSFITAAGTTAERPAVPVVGMIRFNTTESEWEYYTGVEWENVKDTPPPSGPALSWGRGDLGQLGNGASGTSNRISSPVSVIGGFTDWIQLTLGRDHSAGLRANGTIWSWGSNSVGQNGDNSIIAKSSPVEVAGAISDWVQVSSYGTNSCALTKQGRVYTWGDNSAGQLGINVAGSTISSRTSPVEVVGGIVDWVQLSCGYGTMCALTSDKRIYCWGANGSGRLGFGSGTIPSLSSPTLITGGFADWSQVSVGREHSMALRENGTLWAWGRNLEGQLGIDNAINSSSQVTFIGGITDWTSVSAGGRLTAGVRSNGTAWAWGLNDMGQLGIDNAINSSSPVTVIGGITDWIQVSPGRNHTLAVRSE